MELGWTDLKQASLMITRHSAVLPGWVTWGRAYSFGAHDQSLSDSLPLSQTRLQAGVGYGNTLSCIRMVYKRESVSVPGGGGRTPARASLRPCGWGQATLLHQRNGYEAACPSISCFLMLCHTANATLPQLTSNHLVHFCVETGFV